MRNLILFIFLFNCFLTLNAQQFSAENVINPSCGWAQSRIDLELFDIDGDGDKDVVYPSGTNAKVIWHENLGKNTFGPEKTLLKTPYPILIRFADFDKDGDMDFVLTKRNGLNLAWYEKTTDTNYTQHAINYTFSEIYDVAMETGDIDNDGDTDIVFAEQITKKLSLFRNNGLGTFETTVVDSNVQNPAELTLGDLNNDGKLDILTSQKDPLNKTFWYTNLGNGLFSPPIFLANKGDKIFLKDVDQDSMLDVVLTGPNSGKVSWLKNNNNAESFTEKPIIPGGYYSAGKTVAYDFTGDGLIDILHADGWSTKKNIALYENKGNENFTLNKFILYLPLKSFGSLYDMVIEDIDNDGDKDIFYASLADGGMIGWCENFLFNPYRVNGKVYFDKNKNGTMDSLETTLFSFAKVFTDNRFSYTNEDGSYFLALAKGKHTIYSDSIPGWRLTNKSASYNVTLSDTHSVEKDINFGYFPDSLITDIESSIVSTEPRCDSESYIWLTLKNSGTTRPNLVYEFILHDSIILHPYSISYDSLNKNKIYFHKDSLNYFENTSQKIWVHMPNYKLMGDKLNSYLNIYEITSTGNLKKLSADTLSQILICSYDPNDKTVFPIGKGPDGEIKKDQTLDYTIRFQNTGNASAIDIVLKDTLDANLDITSFKLIAASHNVKLTSLNDRQIHFMFENINLAASSYDEPNSHGFVKYSLDPKNNLNPKTKIKNTAYIYFDKNPAIITNTVTNTIECYKIPTPIITYSSSLLKTNLDNNYMFEWRFNDLPITNSNNHNFSPLINGNYTVKISDQYGCSKMSSIYTLQTSSVSSIANNNTSINPNPFSDYFTLQMEQDPMGICDLIVLDILGREELRIKGLHGKTFQINGEKWCNGLKFIVLENQINREKTFISKVEKL